MISGDEVTHEHGRTGEQVERVEEQVNGGRAEEDVAQHALRVEVIEDEKESNAGGFEQASIRPSNERDENEMKSPDGELKASATYLASKNLPKQVRQ